MFQDEITAVANTANKKSAFLTKNPVGYFISSMLAGIYVGFGILLIFTIGGLMAGTSYARIVMGAAFAVALSLVIFAGSELFTGNNLIMFVGLLKKTVSAGKVLKLWLVCFVGNWIGSLLLALLFVGTQLSSGPVGEYISNAAANKMSLPFWSLFLRGLLCNILVCLAVWCGFRCKSESARLIMIFWCLFVFITVGLEHSIANMTLLSIALFNPLGVAVSISGYFYNILVVTLGNLVGGIFFVALPYFIISQAKEN